MRRVVASVAAIGGLTIGLSACGATQRHVDAAPAAAVTAPAEAAMPQSPGVRHTYDAVTPALPRAAWVAVPVATLWNQPPFARPVDAPVLGPDPQVGAWLASMTFQQRLALDNLMATQALMYEPLTVVEMTGGWASVLVDDQTGSVYPHGIGAWVPSSQITFEAPPATSLSVTVSVPVADAGGIGLSYGTRLPVLATTPGSYVVATTAGERTLPAGDVRTAAPPASGQAVLAEAEKFLGLPYLWAGTSGFGYDCSGLTLAVYRQFGITLARDAGDQAAEGTPVPRSGLQPGDLLFFASAGDIHHVGFYAGNGMMLDAPQTGGRVEVVPLWSSPLASQYIGARRYL